MKNLHTAHVEKSRQGFTIVEMILVTIVLSILIGVTTPTLYQYFRQRDMQTEQNTMQELRRALQAYTAEHNALPNINTWSSDLAGYTNLSVREIGTDTWGVSRSFITFTDNTRTLQGSAVPILYASIISSGGDRKASASTGVPVSGNGFAASTSSGWWANMGGSEIATFGNLQPVGDDVLVKYTDFSDKLSRYELTLERLNRVSEALETFAKTNYANQVTLCAGTASTTTLCTTAGAVERQIYYPKATAVASTADTATYFLTSAVVDNGASDANRRTGMINLMRQLGLPDEFCCSALNQDGNSQPKAFYYFSNPRPRTSSGCGTRPDATTYKLPARITSTNNDSGNPPTCG